MKTKNNDLANYIDPDYPYKVVFSGKNTRMIMTYSPTSVWLRNKKYLHIVGGNPDGHTYRFKEHKHAMEFALRWL
jgi:hypothetical protein